MARIRTIKPEFFTSEDIVELPAMARLLYIALWCEADREGRFLWKPRTFKMRYFPADDCDIDALGRVLIESGLVKLYGEGFAFIPRFSRHQHVNPRESKSELPDPKDDACSTRAPRVGTSESTVSDAQVGREGEGKEGESASKKPTPHASASGSRLPADWSLPKDWRAWAVKERPDVDADHEAETFADFWHGKPGKDGRKADWQATWRNWIRRSYSAKPGGGSGRNEPVSLPRMQA